MSILVVTGTGTDIGKTVTTAALASRFAAKRGHRVAVVKPAQTGVAPGGAGDLAEITRLAGVTDTYEYARYPDPVSPHHAAARSGLPALDLADVTRRILDLDAGYDTVLVEGAGGLLVPFTDTDRWTLADLAVTLRAPVVLVTAAGLGTLDYTSLAVGRLAEDGIALAGVVVGSWPAEPDLAARLNLADLAALSPAGRLAGAIPAGSGGLPGPEFRRVARAGLAPLFGGTFDSTAFAASFRY